MLPFKRGSERLLFARGRLTHSLSLLLQNFDTLCADNKAKLDDAGKARESMEKQSNTENEVVALGGRWDEVKKAAADRVEKVSARWLLWGFKFGFFRTSTLSFIYLFTRFVFIFRV